jgi:[ribosomal protein S5]-alanine N-acetyltransferase
MPSVRSGIGRGSVALSFSLIGNPGYSRRMAGWLNDVDLMRYSEQRHRHHTAATVMDYARRAGWYRYVLDGELLVGSVSASIDRFNGVADLGILIGVPGYGGRVWRMALAELGDGYRMLTAGAMAVNKPMVAIMEQTMRFSHVRKGYFLYEGMPTDSVHYVK